MKRPRAFQRDATIAFRLPHEDKQRILEVCRRRRRDVSSVVLESALAFVAKAESEMRQVPAMS